MFRSQSFRPETSKATRSPVPKKNTTIRPSVTGEGEQELLYWPSVVNSVRSVRQSCFPVRRSRHTAACLPEAGSAAGRNTRSPQITGVAAPGPGGVTTHLTFSVLLNFSGRPFSGLEPLCEGPRQLDQFSACRDAAKRIGSTRRIMIQREVERRLGGVTTGRMTAATRLSAIFFARSRMKASLK